MARQQLFGMKWYHWLLIALLAVSGFVAAPVGASIGYYLGLVIGSGLAVAVLVSLWRVPKAFIQGYSDPNS